MTRPVYERCFNPTCQREQACQSEAFCIADADKDIFNEAADLIDAYKFDASFDDSADGAQERNAIKQNLSDMLRAHAEGKDYPGMVKRQ